VVGAVTAGVWVRPAEDDAPTGAEGARDAVLILTGSTGLPSVPTKLAPPAGTIAGTPELPLNATVPSFTCKLRVSKLKLVPRTDAVAFGLCIVQFAFVPAGGFTSTFTLPVCRLTFRLSDPAELCISAKDSRVSGRTVITELPTATTAVLLKPVDIMVSRATG